jgi:hypothetical protein
LNKRRREESVKNENVKKRKRDRKVTYPVAEDIILTNQIITGRIPLEPQKDDSASLKRLKDRIRQSGIPVGLQKIPKTDFIKVLEDIHERTDMRYGQVINNALQLKYGRKDCDCGRDFMSGCECKNSTGAAYDIFGIWDEELTEALEEFRRAYLHSASAVP